MSSPLLWRTLVDQFMPHPTPDITSVPTSNPAFNITSDSAPDHTPTSPWPRPSGPGRNRAYDIFPRGLGDNSTTTGEPFLFAAHQLDELFIRHRGDPHFERILVKSAWYCKRTESVKHEFIVLCIQDPEIPKLRNCMVLDRTPSHLNVKGATILSLQVPLARDTFRVAYDGKLKRFLRKSELTPYQKLEQISFPSNNPLHLWELVTVVHCISKGRPRYTPLGGNCYWFAGLIWECLRQLRLTSKHKAFILAGTKGRLGLLRIIAVANPSRVQSVLRDTAIQAPEAKQQPIPQHDISGFMPNPPMRRGLKYQPPHSPASDLWRNRLHDIFPRGLENLTSTNTSRRIGQSFTYAARQLYDLFDRRIDDPHVQSTVVKSAWYGKQVRAAQHEFIVLHVEDLQIQGLRNCMVIDRNQPGKDAATAFSSPIASDTFRVAYDGDLDRLLQESCLTPHLELEEISFLSDKPLFLHELVILVYHISEGHRRYIPTDTNCYWFSGLIWECLCNLHPTAEYKAFAPARKKGKFGWVRTIPNPIQVRNVLRELAYSQAQDPDDSEDDESEEEMDDDESDAS